MATILAHIRVHPGQEAAFEAVAAELYDGTHANEAGCLRYEYWRGAEPGLYYGLLAFDDYAAFLVHQTSAHHEAVSPRLGELIRELRLEWVDPLATAAPLPATLSQPLPEGEDPLLERTARVFAAQIQDWWLAQRAAP